MLRTRTVLIVICAAGVLLAGLWAWWPDRDAAGKPDLHFQVLTDEEIALRARLEDLGTVNRNLTLSSDEGPVIRVAAPLGYDLVSPVDFDIRIEERDQVPVDMSTLRIDYRLGPAWVNLTRRVLKQARIDGLHFRASGAQLPPGNHRLRVTVQDNLARATRATIDISVRQ